MATTTNYGWTTPDDTALVKDGAAAIRTLGSSVDTTTKALNPSTTLGDIEYRSSTANINTRLGIGTTGQVLTVAGGVPAWGAAPAAGANYSLINTGGTALTGAGTITVSGISAKEKIVIVVDSASSASASSQMSLRINTDSGTNYWYTSTRLRGDSSAYFTNNDDSGFRTSTSAIVLGAMSGSAGSTISTGFMIDGGTTTGGKAFTYNSCTNRNSATAWYNDSGTGVYLGSAAITSVSILSSVGNFDSGTIYVYGSA